MEAAFGRLHKKGRPPAAPLCESLCGWVWLMLKHQAQSYQVMRRVLALRVVFVVASCVVFLRKLILGNQEPRRIELKDIEIRR